MEIQEVLSREETRETSRVTSKQGRRNPTLGRVPPRRKELLTRTRYNSCFFCLGYTLNFCVSSQTEDVSIRAEESTVASNISAVFVTLYGM